MTELINKPTISEDFYTHVNWDWLKSNPIPNEHTKWSNFHVLREQNQFRLKEMLESEPTLIVVENKDRLTRFGFNYLQKLLLLNHLFYLQQNILC